jgi:hypothetical protein
MLKVKHNKQANSTRQQATVKKNSFKVQGSKFNVAQNHPKRSVV